jgi:hypothetical protein
MTGVTEAGREFQTREEVADPGMTETGRDSQTRGVMANPGGTKIRRDLRTRGMAANPGVTKTGIWMTIWTRINQGDCNPGTSEAGEGGLDLCFKYGSGIYTCDENGVEKRAYSN